MSNLVKKIGECDHQWIIDELVNREDKSQIPLQGVFEGDFNGSTGATGDLQYSEEEYNIALYKDMPYTNSLLEKYDMSRTRVMTINQGKCYSYHYDLTPRIHIPLTTNEKCMFIIDDKVYRLPADGSVYFVDTTRYHTALNANRDGFKRTHIVGNIIKP